MTDPTVTALALLTDNAAGDQGLAVRAAALEAAILYRQQMPLVAGFDSAASGPEQVVSNARTFEAYLSAPPAGLNDAERTGLAELLDTIAEHGRDGEEQIWRMRRYAQLLRGQESGGE